MSEHPSPNSRIFLPQNDNVGCGQKNTSAIKRIAIVGGDMTGWTVAAGLANGLRDTGVEIALIENPVPAEKGLYTEATTPACVAFHRWLGISELDLVEKTGASFLLATRFNRWAGQQQQYFMPFIDHGFMLNRIEFPQYAISQYLNGGSLNYDDFSLASVAAKAGRFCHPSAQDASLFSTLSYGFVLNTHAYTEYLRGLAMSSGVACIKAETKTINLNAQGFIETISLAESIHGVNAGTDINSHWIDENNLLAADLFIDCSGVAAQLTGCAMQMEWLPLVNSFTSMNKQSPVTHVLRKVQPLHTDAAIPVARELSPAEHGWIQTNTSQTHIEQQYFYHADLASKQQVCADLGVGASITDVQEISLGRRAAFWHNNCIAMGTSACNPDQLAMGNLHLVQSAVLRLINLFPSSLNAVFNRAEYNRLTHLELDNIEDFHALHYQLANSQRSEYWQNIARSELSCRLLHKLELFKKRGVIAHYENETFFAGVWTSLLLGNGFWPQRHDPLIRSMDQQWISQQLEKMKALMKSAAESMPMQRDYLQRVQQKSYSTRECFDTGYAFA